MWVVGGSRTGDEMTISHLQDKGYEKLVAEREAKQKRSLAGSD